MNNVFQFSSISAYNPTAVFVVFLEKVIFETCVTIGPNHFTITSISYRIYFWMMYGNYNYLNNFVIITIFIIHTE